MGGFLTRSVGWVQLAARQIAMLQIVTPSNLNRVCVSLAPPPTAAVWVTRGRAGSCGRNVELAEIVRPRHDTSCRYVRTYRRTDGRNERVLANDLGTTDHDLR